MITRTALLSLSSAVFTALLLGCSAPTPEPKTEPEPTAEPKPATTAEPEATTDPTSAPSASASSGSSVPPPSGRAGISFSGSEKITNTFGASPAAKLDLGPDGAWLRIPEYALDNGVLITFMIDKKVKKAAKGGVGAVYRLQGQNPPSEAYSTINTRGPAFVLRVPTAKVASPNLAIGETLTDEKGKETTTWKVIAPKSKEDAFATFELTGFTNTMLQVTSEGPSGG